MKQALIIATVIALLLHTVAEASEVRKFRYDAKGRLVKIERTGTVNNAVTTDYSHDKANNRIRVKTVGSANGAPA